MAPSPCQANAENNRFNDIAIRGITASRSKSIGATVGKSRNMRNIYTVSKRPTLHAQNFLDSRTTFSFKNRCECHCNTYIAKTTTNPGHSGCHAKLSAHFLRAAAQSARVIPQLGQGNPVRLFTTQGRPPPHIDKPIAARTVIAMSTYFLWILFKINF